MNILETFNSYYTKRFGANVVTGNIASTVLKEGIIIKAWQEVASPEGHAVEILEYLKTLN